MITKLLKALLNFFRAIFMANTSPVEKDTQGPEGCIEGEWHVVS